MRGMAALILVGLGSIGVPSVEAYPDSGHTSGLALESSEGRTIDPLASGPDVRVFVFVRRDCPIANRYAPELARLQRSVSAAGPPPAVTLWLVYVDASDTAALVAAHQREYGLDTKWLIDRAHALARAAGATVTPEAAVYGPSTAKRPRVYLGRIDDRFVDVGQVRASATVHDLRDAIEAARKGQPARAPRGPAVGCFIADAR